MNVVEQLMLRLWLERLKALLEEGETEAVIKELTIALERIEEDQDERSTDIGRASEPVAGSTKTGDVRKRSAGEGVAKDAGQDSDVGEESPRRPEVIGSPGVTDKKEV